MQLLNVAAIKPTANNANTNNLNCFIFILKRKLNLKIHRNIANLATNTNCFVQFTKTNILIAEISVYHCIKSSL
ncbi:MAG: hypothetical protein BGO32_01125 [Bacteroidetes bacterium 37-13]|nr:MAG: hypothetical protein BGO32_01125 [Bacteroidetes bacterium 37-13]